MAKITQTAGRNALGEFAPEFAHYNDDVLFGENWNNEDIDVKTRSIITGSPYGIRYHRFFFEVSSGKCQGTWCDAKGDCGYHHTCCFLCRLAEGLGSL